MLSVINKYYSIKKKQQKKSTIVDLQPVQFLSE